MRNRLPVLLAAAAIACAEAPPDAASNADVPALVFPNASLVLLSLDTLRADGLSVFGGPAGISPTLDDFARESIVFEHARAPAPHTAPSHMSLFTSLTPSVHGVENYAGKRAPVRALPDEVPTLAEVLEGAGFATVALTDAGNLNPSMGFARGFGEYEYELTGARAKAERGARAVRELAAGSGRFFLFWHTYEIHAPYVPPDRFAAEWAPGDYDGLLRPVVDGLRGLPPKAKWRRMGELWRERDAFGRPEARFLRGLYDGGVAFTDRRLAGLLTALADSGALDSSVVVVFSDHGEEFFEHGAWKHEQLYEECLRVPLLVRLPGGRGGGRRVATPVSLVDLMPTLLELLGVDPARVPGLAMEGRSFASLLGEGEAEWTEQPITSELLTTDRDGSRIWDVAHYAEGTKIVVDALAPAGSGAVELYRLDADPGEARDLAAEEGALLEELLGVHRAWREGVEARRAQHTGRESELPPDVIRQLEELGYGS